MSGRDALPPRAARSALGLLLLLAACGRGGEPRPNLVLIIGDDHGYPYAGFMGSTIVQTPNLDRLAREGTVFTTAYVTASTCRPSLLSLLTGLYPYQIDRRVERLARQGVVLPRRQVLRDFETLPGLLRERGYVSYQAGKLWGGSYRTAGFSDGTAGESVTGGMMVRAMGGVESIRIGRITMEPVYDFIDAHAGEPFFLWFAPLLPHAPLDAPRRYRAPYEETELTRSAARYYGNISWFDDVVGALVAHLDRAGLRARTLVVYLSDNGFEQGPDEERVQAVRYESGPRGKGSMHELGFRTPIIFNWPGRVPAAVVRDDLVSSVDLAPTLLAYAGGTAPPGWPGRDLRPLLEGRAAGGRPFLVGHMPNAFAPDRPGQPTEAFFVRTSRWHHIWYTGLGRDELYDVAADPREDRDVAADHPGLVLDFRRKVHEWKEAIAAHSR